MEPMIVQANGWGIQSWCISNMAIYGELPMPDAVLHADTTHEASATYEFARLWTPYLEEHDVNVVTVTSGVYDKWLTSPRLNGHGTPPFFTRRNMVNGKMKRSCTQRWKIAPMRRWIQANRAKRQPVELWLGISYDEYQRVKDSDVKYITHRHPLVDLRMTRDDCIRWLQDHDLPVPPKSACTFCPFHDAPMWRQLHDTGNGDWERAIQVDEAIRNARLPYRLYVHPSRQPLREVDLSTADERVAAWNEECAGICGV